MKDPCNSTSEMAMKSIQEEEAQQYVYYKRQEANSGVAKLCVVAGAHNSWSMLALLLLMYPFCLLDVTGLSWVTNYAQYRSLAAR